MTLNVLLPNGANANLDDLNEHDLAQFYMYQMDMLQQAERLFDILGIERWRDGEELWPRTHSLDIARESKHACEFLAAPAPGNVLPTFYDPNTWQGAIVKPNGRRDSVYVDTMTREQLVADIEKQGRNLNAIVMATHALSNFSSNVAAATQAPDLDLTM